MLNSVGTIELTGGSQLISMIAEQDVLLTDVSDVGGNAIAASLEIQAGDNVNLRSVSLDGTTTDGSLTVSFDTNDADANTLHIDGNISNVSTLQFTGGSDTNDIVDINADISAGSIKIRDAESVLIDASVSRNLTAMDGNVSIHQIVDGIEIDGGDSLVTINATSNVLLAPVTVTASAALAIQFDSDSNESITFDLDATFNDLSALLVSGLSVSGGGEANSDNIVINNDLSTSSGNIELKDVEFVTIDASVDRSLNAKAGSLLLDSVGTIELTGGSQSISMIAEQDVLLTDVSDVGGNAIAASLEIQAGDNVNLRSVSLDGTTTDGSLTVSFDTNVTDANTLLIDGNISNVSTLQFTGGTDVTGGTDANDIVDFKANLHASIGDIEFQNLELVKSFQTSSHSIRAETGDLRFMKVANITFEGEANLFAGNDFNLDTNSAFSAGSNININAGKNLILGKWSELRITDAASKITGIAGNTVEIKDGAKVIRSLSSTDEVVITNFQPGIIFDSIIPPGESSDINVFGQAALSVEVLQMNLDRNFAISITDSGNDKILFDTSTRPSPTVAGKIELPMNFGFSTGETSFGNKEILVTFHSDRDNQIVFVAGGETLTTREVKLELKAPADGLMTAIPITSPEMPDLVSVTQAEELPFEINAETMNDFAKVQFAINSHSESEIEQERSYVLRLVVTDELGEEKEIEISNISSDVLDQEKLPALFASLPDDRYRIYLILEDGSEQSVLDVNIRNHQAVEVESNDETLPFEKLDIEMDLDQPLINPDDSVRINLDNSFPAEHQAEQDHIEIAVEDEFLLIGKIPIDLRAG